MNKTIIRFRYENLRNEAHVEFHTNLNLLMTRFGAQALGIAAQYAVYKPLLDEEVSVLDIIRKSELTGELEEKDLERDHLFRGFADTVKGYLNHFDESRRTAARKLEVVLEHYGNITAKSYDEETAAIEDLYRELLKPENAGQITLLGLGEWLGQLVQANRNFEAMMMARYDESAQRPTIRMKNVRAEVDKVFRSIIDLLEALVCVNGADTNKAFIVEVNVIMERYKNILAQEAGRRAKSHPTPKGGEEALSPRHSERSLRP